MYYTEWIAFNWLLEEHNIKAVDIFHGSEFTDPTFVYMGNIGYEVKTMNGRTVTFVRGKYDTLRDGWQGEVLCFKGKAESPEAIIPFTELPENGGTICGVHIVLINRTSRQSMVAVSPDEKEKMEIIRGIIETKTIPQNDWGDMLVQALCAVLYDQALIKSVNAKRIGSKYFVADCPYCDKTLNQLDVGVKLYWLQKCTGCGREFVAKRKLENKILT